MIAPQTKHSRNRLLVSGNNPVTRQASSNTTINITGDEASSALDVMFIIELLSPLILSYISISFLLQTKDDFRFVIPYVEFSRELKGGRPLVLDVQLPLGIPAGGKAAKEFKFRR